MLHDRHGCGIVLAGCLVHPRWGTSHANGGARFAVTVDRRHALLVDAAVPVLVAAVILAGTLVHGGVSARPLPVAVGIAAAASLWARRRAPGWTLAISGALVAALLLVRRLRGSFR